MHDQHKLTDPITLHRGRHLALVAQQHWEYAVRTVASAAVGIAAVTPDRRLLLVEQFRIPAGCKTIEIPAGLVGDSPELAGEELLVAAQRELLEETGYESDRWTPLGEGLSSPGLTDESVTLYLAEDIRKTGTGGGDESESIVVHEVPLEEVDAWIESRRQQGGRFDFKVWAALHLLSVHRGTYGG